jgi:PhnB protein
MQMAVKPIPDGYHTVTPHITVNDGNKAIEFYKKAFGAKEVYRMPGPGGKIMHAEIQIGDSMIMLNDEFPEMDGSRSAKSLGGSAVTLNLYVPDVDKLFNQAVAAGATATMPVADMFWGDRYGKLKDPFGHNWSIATHKEDVTPEEVMKRAQAEFSNK